MGQVVTTLKDLQGNTIATTTVEFGEAIGGVYVQSDVEIGGVNTSGKLDVRVDGAVIASIERTDDLPEAVSKGPVS